MEPDPWLGGAVALAVGLLIVIAVLSALETAVLSSRRSRLAQMELRGTAAAEALLDAPEAFQSSAHLAKSLCEALLYAAAALSGLYLSLRLSPPLASFTLTALLHRAWPGLLTGSLVAYFSVTLLGETIPKSLASRRPERLLVSWTGFIQVFTLLFTPIRLIAAVLAQVLCRITGADPAQASRAAHSEEEIKLLVEGSAEEGVLEEEEKEMIHSIFEFTDTVTRQVMVPRIDVHSVSADGSLDDVMRLAMESGHSRLPVYEGTLDNVMGVVHVKDLLPYLARGEREVPVRRLVRDPFFVPEGKKIDELLQEFRKHKSQLAIVVDEYGGTSGLVTMEDIVEEIVGEIEDEYDVETAPTAEIMSTGEGSLVDARMTLEDVNEALDLNLPAGDYDTFGGFVFSLFGHPPAVGERVTHDGHDYVAEAVEGRRLLKIRIVPKTAEDEPADSPGATTA